MSQNLWKAVRGLFRSQSESGLHADPMTDHEFIARNLPEFNDIDLRSIIVMALQGSAPAQFMIADSLLRAEDPVARERGREFLRAAARSSYIPAQRRLRQSVTERSTKITKDTSLFPGVQNWRLHRGV